MPSSHALFTALCIIGCAAGFAPSVGSARAAACAPLRMAGFGASVKTKKPKPAAASGPGIGKGQGPLEKQWNTFAELRDADGAAFHDVWARPAGSEGAWKKAGRVACANGASADEAVSAQFVLIGWSALDNVILVRCPRLLACSVGMACGESGPGSISVRKRI